jgi:hypothetical protein
MAFLLLCSLRILTAERCIMQIASVKSVRLVSILQFVHHQFASTQNCEFFDIQEIDSAQVLKLRLKSWTKTSF